jgi:hypothetical protein
MNRKKMSVVCAAVTLCAPLTFALDSHAGEVLPEYAQCNGNSTSGGCWGTLDGFRNSSDPNAQAEFQMVATSTGFTWSYFTAQIQGVYYSCTPNAALTAVGPSVLNADGAFLIEWANGECNYLVLANSSSYHNSR